MRPRFFHVLALCALPLSSPSPSTAADAPVDFAHEIAPLFKEHCGKCHLEDQKKGGLSMNTREALLEGSENGPVATPGKPEESRLLEVLVSTDPDEQMPPKGPRLSAEQVDKVRRWIAGGMPWEPGFAFGQPAYEAPLKPRRPELPPAQDGREHPVDRILDHYLAERGVERPAPLDDAGFIRRLTLDLTGLLPKPEEVEAFVHDPAPDKRAKLIDAVLARNTEYAEHWLTFWNDLLRNDYQGTGYIDGGRRPITKWLYNALIENKPYDAFARELLAPPTPESEGFIQGIQWRGEVNASQTREIQFSQSVSQTFLGINMKCASCHDSFVDRWKLDEAYGLAAIFSEKPLEMARCDKPTGRMAKAAWIFPELGQVDPDAPRAERLKQLAALMTHPENGRFTRTIVNRLWHRLMGRGIVHPVDAMDTPPWSADLLDYLAARFADDGYDLKKTLAFIASSQAYQSRSVPARENESVYVYRGPVAKRLTAEEFVDAVWTLTGTAPEAPHPGVPRRAGGERAPVTGQWIWSSAEGSANAPAGETITLRKEFTLPAKPASARMVAVCDNACEVIVNGKSIYQNDAWDNATPVALKGLKAGANVILIKARNGGESPNPAGLFFEAVIKFPEGRGDPVTLASDESWQWTAAVPGRDGTFAQAPADWRPAAAAANPGAWNAARGRIQTAVNLARDPGPPVRASLVPADLLMRALGRPNREQIVSMRPESVTTLEAIDLANGEILAGLLRRGARNLSEEHPSRSAGELMDDLFRRALGRPPTDDEKATLLPLFGDGRPEPKAIEDLLWLVLLLPEFQFVR